MRFWVLGPLNVHLSTYFHPEFNPQNSKFSILERVFGVKFEFRLPYKNLPKISICHTHAHIQVDSKRHGARASREQELPTGEKLLPPVSSTITISGVPPNMPVPMRDKIVESVMKKLPWKDEITWVPKPSQTANRGISAHLTDSRQGVMS